MTKMDQLTEILPTVSKPTRYLGDELNAVRKDINNQNLIRFALAFPDIYDVGMSHLGFKILYQILNSRDDVWAERAYVPWVDMEMEMREKGIPLSGLESASPLRDFDIVGFSLQYEMSYSNILNMLELAQIPFLSENRDESYPLIIAGGPCAFNPEPMADFIDFFVIGDGEEVITEIVDCYKSHRNKDKKTLLSKMADIEGIYVPSLASVEEQPDGTLTVSGGLKIRKRVISDLDTAPYPVDYLVPFMRPIHDRVIIEVMRGCSRGCRFCQAGMIYRPVRERSPDVVGNLAAKLIGNTGYEELSLSSLSTCDHSSIHEILQQLIEPLGMKKHVSISLPSLRTDAFSVELARSLADIGKTGLTFAPEVATLRMQNVVNKRIPRSNILSTVESAFSSGWDSLKLYFMIGLPTETEEDIVEIAYLIKDTLNAALRVNRRASINVSVSTFIPKAHTPFQWEGQLSSEEVLQKQRLLMDQIGKNRRLKVSFHSPQVSYLEGIFARGDRKLGKVLLVAHELGCKMDGWSEFFDFDAWMQAFAQCGIDPDVYLKARKPEQVLPWDHIDAYLTKDFLQTERDKAYEAELTPDCRWGECSDCGVCDEGERRVIRLAPSDTQQSSASGVEQPVSSAQRPASSIKNSVIRIRFGFAKGRELRFISHLNLLNTFTRAFRRAEIPIAYSHGFNPHPKIKFGSVLSVGVTGDAEFADIDLEAYMEPDDFVSRSNAQLPPGLVIFEARGISLETRSLMAQINFASYIVRIPATVTDPESRIHSVLNMDHLWIERSHKSKKRSKKRTSGKPRTSSFVDIRPLIRDIKLLKQIDGILELEMILGDGNAGKVRPEEVIRLILSESTEDTEQDSVPSLIEIRKIGSFIEHHGQLLSPMEIIGQ